MTALHWLSAPELRAGYASRQFTPTDVMDHLLARIDAHESALHVFIRLDRDAARQAAAQATRDIAAGISRGPLHGIPVALKDNIDAAGQPTTCHSKIMLDHVAETDAFTTAQLRRGGAILLGKVALHEFALGPAPSLDLPFPYARNPWGPEYFTGGSSTGSAVGLAAGFFPLAVGTDTGGSIRNPSSACGTVGLKPTYGLVSRHGVFPLSFTMDHVGPMARDVAGAALLLETLAGHDALDPGSVTAPSTIYTQDLDRGVAGLRIGFVRHFHERDIVADPAIAELLEQAAGIFAREGAAVHSVTLPSLQELVGPGRVIMSSEAWAIHAPWLRARPQDYGDKARSHFMAGAFHRAEHYIQAQRRRRELIAATQQAFREFDVLICANYMRQVARIDDPKALALGGKSHARTPFNVTGHPAISIPAGLLRMPVGFQIVGPYFGEATVLRVAKCFERATGFSDRHPAL